MAPETPLVPAFLEPRTTSPLLVAVPAPLNRDSAPPVEDELVPPIAEISPPVPV